MPNKTPETPLNYEDAIAELEGIVHKMESENLPLEQSLDAYKRGVELLKACQQSLSNAEQEVRIISEANKLTAFSPDKE
ncbi:MAG: exodeoxyribonuclease VII small subunit [Methylophilaceae bacterium]|nr:exodeoxyribonuclease VII small subunit [Methylophilaceae bacterium]|tara:strand:- start:378 stop:614 length:237 start_codon:yes stop_codon:yes gene_type:complete